MNPFPDFCDRGYQVITPLGHNSLGGRVTYLANQTASKQSASQQQVVIKQFQFAQLDSSWAAYDSYEQEIVVLRQLNHPGIPRYLDCFQTADGFCMVQEYLNAEALARPRHWTPEQIKHIAISVLEILVYLQAQTPPIIHRDLKPENILIDDQQSVYLIDFGFARLGGGEIAASSLVKGTVGFMPPEQLFNRQLTPASDLYGLGATLICLLTGTPSSKIGSLLDERYHLHFQHLVPPLKRGWLGWLTKLVEPKPQNRYASAAAALAALEPMDVNRAPRARLSHDRLELAASQFGDRPTQHLTVSNAIPNTLLSGRWEVAPHDSDPPHTPYDHAWIAVEPPRFQGNEVDCQIVVDTHKLRADSVYQRTLVLQTNGSPEPYEVSLQLQTAPAPTVQRPPYWSLLGMGCLVLAIPWLLSYLVLAADLQSGYYFLPFIACFMVVSLGFPAVDRFSRVPSEAGFGRFVKIILGSMVGLAIGSLAGLLFAGVFAGVIDDLVAFPEEIAAILMVLFGLGSGAIGAIGGASIGAQERRFVPLVSLTAILAIASFAYILSIFYDSIFSLFSVLIVLFILGASVLMLQSLIRPVVKRQMRRGASRPEAVQIALLVIGLAMSLNVFLMAALLLLEHSGQVTSILEALGWIGAIAIAPIALILFLLFKFLIQPHRRRLKLVAQYTQSQSSLIHP